MLDETSYPYDIAISYASEDRACAEALADALIHKNVKVFYDRYNRSTLWGKNLYEYLSDLYQCKARYCVMLLSKDYASKVWTNHERSAAQTRAVHENKEYILPICLDDTKMPGYLEKLVYLKWHEETLDFIVAAILEKLGDISQISAKDTTPEKSVPEVETTTMQMSRSAPDTHVEHESNSPPLDPVIASAEATEDMDHMPPQMSLSVANSIEDTNVFSLLKDDFDDEGDMLAPPPFASTPTNLHLQPPADSKHVVDDDGNTDVLPIELPVRRTRTTAQLNPKTIVPAGASKARSSGTLAAGAAGAAGTAGLAAAASQRASSGANPPLVHPTLGGSRPTGPRRRRGRGWLVALMLPLVLLLISGGVMIYASSTRDTLARVLSIGQPTATVGITPASQVVSDSYVITGVSNNPDPARLQIGLHPLTKTAQQQKTVTGSGHNLMVGKAATGELTFTNGSSAPFIVAAGTTFKKANGVVIVTNTALVVPAGVPGVSYGTAVVSAHATTPGAAGNLPAQAINGTCCTNGNFIFAVNETPFTGGQDPKDYRFVQQGDIDAVVTPLKQPLFQQVWSDMQKQMASGEQLMSQIQCTTSSSTDQPVGDKGINVSQTVVTVKAMCTGTVYNRQQMLDLVKGQLQKKMDASLGTDYALVGGMQTNINPQTPKDGMVSFLVDVRGVWVYQWTEARKQALAKQIAGKSVKDATALLQGQKGISKAQFSGMNNLLPVDPTQIAVEVQSITGLPGSANPPAVTPTVVDSASGTGGATAVPSNGNIGAIAIFAY